MRLGSGNRGPGGGLRSAWWEGKVPRAFRRSETPGTAGARRPLAPAFSAQWQAHGTLDRPPLTQESWRTPGSPTGDRRCRARFRGWALAESRQRRARPRNPLVHGSVLRAGCGADLGGDRAAVIFLLYVADRITVLQVLEPAVGHAVAMEIWLRSGTVQAAAVVGARHDQGDLAGQRRGARRRLAVLYLAMNASPCADGVQAQPSSFSARPECQIFVMCTIRPSLNCMT